MHSLQLEASREILKSPTVEKTTVSDDSNSFLPEKHANVHFSSDEKKLASVSTSVCLSEDESSRFDNWYKLKSIKTPGISIASRLIYGAVTETIRSIDSKYLSALMVESIFCSICLSPDVEAHVQRMLKPAFSYIMKIRGRNIDTYYERHDQKSSVSNASVINMTEDDVLLEIRLLGKQLFTCSQIMSIIEQDMHGLGTLLHEQYEAALEIMQKM